VGLPDSAETFMNPAQMLCDARVLGVVRLRGDVAKIVGGNFFRVFREVTG